MLRTISILFILLLSGLNLSAADAWISAEIDRNHPNTRQLLELFLDTQDDQDADKLKQQADRFWWLVKKSKSFYQKDTIRWMHQVYHFLQKHQLKTYQTYVPLGLTLESGAYDCLTGTALMGLIMHELGVRFDVLEFEYHVMLKGFANGKEFLIESTDPLKGFVVHPKEIAHRVKMAANPPSLPIGNISLQSFDIPTNIGLIELAGLQYFNFSVIRINQQHFNKAAKMLEEASALYPSVRMGNMRRLLSIN